MQNFCYKRSKSGAILISERIVDFGKAHNVLVHGSYLLKMWCP